MATETESRVREVLTYISPNCDRETWWRVAAGVNHALGPAGFDAFDDWSKNGDSYDPAACRSTYRSFVAEGKVKFNTVVWLAEQEGYDPKNNNFVPPTPEQRAAIDAKAKEAAKVAAVDRQERANKARERAERMVEEAKDRPATKAHLYIKNKGIETHGLTVGNWEKRFKDAAGNWQSEIIENVLYVKVFDKARKLQSVQGITPEGDKFHLPGAAKTGNFSPIAGTEPGLVLAEGWATAASIHEATGRTVLCCFDAGNILHVAKAIKESGKVDPATVTIAADNDTESEAEGKGNTGMKAAFEAGVQHGMKVAFVKGGGDFNDFVQKGREQGLSEETIKANVQKLINAATVPTEDYKPAVAPGAAEPAPVEAGDAPMAPSASPASPAAAPLPARVRRVDDAADEVRDEDEPLEPTTVMLDDDRPTIKIERNNVKAINDQAEAALLVACRFLYSRGGDIVRPMIALMPDGRGGKIRTIKIRRLTRAALHELLDSAANWIKFDARSKKDVAIDAPMQVADALLARGSSKLRPLNAVIEAPTLRADGSILDVPGYDAATGLLYAPSCEYAPLPQHPTMADAAAALKRIEAGIDKFPYVSPVDRSVALAAVLTCAVRRSLPRAPMFGMGAPAAGSGKSTLVDYACIIATGAPVPVFSQGSDEAEMEKRLHGALLAGHAVVSFDNVTRPIEGNALCQAMTQEFMEVRPLGTSETRTVPTSTTFFATGNGLVVRDDMTRRVLECQLDPGTERPELRSFTFDPLELAKADRASLLVDALIVIRAHQIAKPGARSKRFGFDKWSAMVADALVWLGYADPAEAMDRTRANDPAKDEFRAVAREWNSRFGTRLASVREAIEAATEQIAGFAGMRHEYKHPDFREALLQIAGVGGAINSRTLGKWLARHVKAVVDGLTVLKADGAQGVQRWGFGPAVVAAGVGAAVDDGPPL